MQRSYAVYWNEGDGGRSAGRLELEQAYVQLAGRAAAGVRSLVRIRYVDIAAVIYAEGRLQIERPAEPPLIVGSVDGPGALREVADRLQNARSPA
jgi:hypothetical protein